MRSVSEPLEGLPAITRAWVQPQQAEEPPDAGVLLLTDASGRWQEVMAAGPGVLLLVRPDGHIAARLNAACCPEQTPEQRLAVWEAIWRALMARGA